MKRNFHYLGGGNRQKQKARFLADSFTEGFNWFFSECWVEIFPLEQVKNVPRAVPVCIEWVEDLSREGKDPITGDPKLSKPGGGYKKNVLTKETLLNLTRGEPR